jgi:hypothetical protein
MHDHINRPIFSTTVIKPGVDFGNQIDENFLLLMPDFSYSSVWALNIKQNFPKGKNKFIKSDF